MKTEILLLCAGGGLRYASYDEDRPASSWYRRALLQRAIDERSVRVVGPYVVVQHRRTGTSVQTFKVTLSDDTKLTVS